MALTKAKLMELIDNGDIDVGGGGFSPNILHNWDFTNPINQRGVSGEISTGTYFFDRWIRNSGTVTVGVGYLTLESGAVIEQRIEGNLLAGLICTVSFEVGGTIYHGSGAFPVSNGTVSVVVDGYPDITFGCATGYMFVMIPATSETSVKRIKCELGTASTLHLDPPAQYVQEMLKAQDVLYKMAVGQAFYGLVSTASLAYIYIPIYMRTTPTLIGAPNFTARVNGQSISGGTFSAIARYDNMLRMTLSFPGGLPLNHPLVAFVHGESAFLSAEL